jgi:hypothetical protein
MLASKSAPESSFSSPSSLIDGPPPDWPVSEPSESSSAYKNMTTVQIKHERKKKKRMQTHAPRSSPPTASYAAQ